MSDVPGFSPGDKVWPKEGPMVLQHAPQVVIASWRSHTGTDWLWLDWGDGEHPGSAYAVNWTTEEPSPAEVAERKERAIRLAAEYRQERRGNWQCCSGT